MKKLFLLFFAGLVAFSCANDPSLDSNLPSSGAKFRITTRDFSTVSTRATNENAIESLYILQYIGNKFIQMKALTEPEVLSAIYDGFDLPVEDMDEEDGNVVFFFANIKESDHLPTLDGNSTLNDLYSHTFSFEPDDAFAEYLPMRGEFRGKITAGVTNDPQNTIVLTRMVAKIDFTFDATALDRFVVTSVQLKQVPKVLCLPKNTKEPFLPSSQAFDDIANLPAGFVAYPTGAETGSHDNLSAITTFDDNTSVIGSYTWYVAENARGSWTGITTNKEKNPLNGTFINTNFKDQAPYCTYVELVGTCVNSVNELRDVSYRIYLGGNAFGDMNIIGNTYYTVTTTITGINESDTRITVNKVEATLPNKVLYEANSYILNPENADKVFFIPVSQAVKGVKAVNAIVPDGISFNSTSVSNNASVLWQTWQATSPSNKLVVSMAGNNQYIRVLMPSGVQPGNNAVVALKNNADEIVWSWHLWITDYNPYSTPVTNGALHTYSGNAFTSGIYKNSKIMDRNLGATWTGSTPAPVADAAQAAKAYGLMYQWGRKDAFTSASGTSLSAAVPIYNGEIDSLPLTEDTGLGTGINKVIVSMANNLANAVQNPMTFYFGANTGSSGYDWYTNEVLSVSTRNDNLWSPSGAKSVFDPCPEGYRVPVGGATAANNPWAGFSNNDPASTANVSTLTSTPTSWAINGTVGDMIGTLTGATAGRLYNDVNAWYPAAGHRSSASGSFDNVGSSGYCWSSSSSGNSGFSLSFSTTSVSPASNSYRASGFPVRCIAE